MVVEKELPNGQKINVVNIAGVVTTIREKVIKLDNEKETPYQLGTVKIVYPDNQQTDEVDARFYTNSIKAHPEVFTEGGKVMLEVQADGPYAGRAVAKLGGNTVNVARLTGAVKLATTTAETAEEPKVVS